MSAAADEAALDTLYLARCEEGGACKVTPIDPTAVKLPDYGARPRNQPARLWSARGGGKQRAKIQRKEPRAWRFEATRTALGKQLCAPGFAAIGLTHGEALDALLRFMAQYQQARRCR